MQETVLIIEDDRLSGKLFRDLLRSEGYRTLVAEGGREGIARAEQDRPSLIIVDLQLPDISGFAVMRTIRATPALASIPMLATSAFRASVDVDWPLSPCCDGFVAKPVGASQFFDQVARLLHGESRAETALREVKRVQQAMHLELADAIHATRSLWQPGQLQPFQERLG